MAGSGRGVSTGREVWDRLLSVRVSHSAGPDPSLSVRAGALPSPLFRGSGDAAGMRMRGVKSAMKESKTPGFHPPTPRIHRSGGPSGRTSRGFA
jgi:hypothetical protein